jgi:tetratricopeptide (TPR) repeat protein
MRRIVIVGGFQAHAIAGLYERFVAVRTGEHVIRVPRHRRAEPGMADAIRQADILVEQTEQTPPGRSPNGCPVVAIPFVAAPFLWPFAGQPHPSNTPFPFLPSGPYGGEAGDRFLNGLIAEGVGAEDALARYLALDIAREARLDDRLEEALAAQRARDEVAGGWPVAETVAAWFRREPVFLSPTHPNARVCRVMATELFRRLGARPDEIERMARATTRAPMPREELPVHPGLARHLGLRWVGPQRRWRLLNEGSFSFPEWVRRYMRYEWNAALEEGLAASRGADVARAAGLLQAGLARSPGSAEGQIALAHLMARQDRWEEAIAAGERAVAADPGLAVYRVELGALLARAGRREEAEAMYREAIAVEPWQAKAQVLLAALLSARGEKDAAGAWGSEALVEGVDVRRLREVLEA